MSCSLLDDLTIERLTTGDNAWIDITTNQAKQIIDTTNTLKDWGLDVQDPIIQMAFLSVHFITAIFIINGLHFYQTNIGFQDINVNYIVLLIVFLEMIHICSFTIIPLIGCDGGTIHIHLMVAICDIFIITLWCLWLRYSCSYKCCRICKWIIVGIAFMVIALFVFIGTGLTTFALGQVAVIIFQLLTPLLLASMVAQGFIPCNNSSMNIYIFQSRWCKKLSFWLFLSIICLAVQAGVMALIITKASDFYDSNLCIMWIFIWGNPLFMVINIFLLFTSAKYFIITFHVAAISIYLLGIVNPYMCLYIINVVYLMYSFVMPLLMITIFMASEELNQWKSDLVSLYLLSFDEIITLVVIYHYITDTNDYFFAAFLISFTIFSNVFGTISNKWFGEQYQNLSNMDKIIGFLGLGANYFKIKSWRQLNQDEDGIYTKLAMKHKIWGVMFETFPSLALRIYASLVTDSSETDKSLSLRASILFSCVNVMFSVWQYIVKITKEQAKHEQVAIELVTNESTSKQTEHYTGNNNKSRDPCIDSSESNHEIIDIKSSDDEKSISCMEHVKLFIQKNIMSEFEHVVNNKDFHINISLFMISDFYVRSMPILSLMAVIPHNFRTTTFCPLFAALAIFEFVLNKWMRIKEYSSNGYVINIFSVSIFSSFYNLLCSLDILKDDPFYGYSVVFESFMIEHRIRILLSMIISVLDIAMLFSRFSVDDAINESIVLLVFYILFLILNIWLIKSNKISTL